MRFGKTAQKYKINLTLQNRVTKNLKIYILPVNIGTLTKSGKKMNFN